MKRFITCLFLIISICLFGTTLHAGQKTIPEVLQKMRTCSSEVQSLKCLFVKEVSKEGKEIPKTSMTFRYKKDPETIFLEFVDRHKGQKCLYVKGENKGKMVVRPPGVMKFMKVKVDPTGEKAMAESLGPIMNMAPESIVQNIEAFYNQSLADERFKAAYEENVAEDGGLFHLLKIASASEGDGYIYIHINRDSFLPYKIKLRYGNNKAIYTYKDLELNKSFTDKDFKI